MAARTPLPASLRFRLGRVEGEGWEAPPSLIIMSIFQQPGDVWVMMVNGSQRRIWLTQTDQSSRYPGWQLNIYWGQPVQRWKHAPVRCVVETREESGPEFWKILKKQGPVSTLRPHLHYTFNPFWKRFETTCSIYTSLNHVVNRNSDPFQYPESKIWGIPSPDGIPLWGYQLFFFLGALPPPKMAVPEGKDSEGNLALAWYLMKTFL